jgi:hypothetical protein
MQHDAWYIVICVPWLVGVSTQYLKLRKLPNCQNSRIVTVGVQVRDCGTVIQLPVLVS